MCIERNKRRLTRLYASSCPDQEGERTRRKKTQVVDTGRPNEVQRGQTPSPPFLYGSMSIPGTAVDNVLQRLRKHSSRPRQGEFLARFLVTKLSWRGNYRRILGISSTSIVTIHPETLVVTNAWSFAGDDPEISAVETKNEHPEGSVFVIHFRKDKRGPGSRDAKFCCQNRAVLLGFVYEAAAVAARAGQTVPRPLAETSFTFSAFKLRRGEWKSVILRVTATAVERLDPDSDAIVWRWRYISAASPAIRFLAQSSLSRDILAFAMVSKYGRSPRVYASKDRDSIVRSIQSAAYQSMGLALAAETTMSEELTGESFLTALASAERERAATPEESPLNEWEVLRVHEMQEMYAISDAQMSQSHAKGKENSKTLVPRRLVLTSSGIIERRPSTYEIAEWRQLPSIAALIRYDEDPQLLGIEWKDAGSVRSIYVTPARDSVLSALLYTAQTASGRPIPVLPYPTANSWFLSSAAGQPTTSPSALICGEEDNIAMEIERMALHHMQHASEKFLASGGGNMSLDALALAGITAMTAAAVVSSDHDSGRKDAIPALEGDRQATTSQEDETLAAIASFERRIKEFNTCTPYAGVRPDVRVDDTLLTALLRYLPTQQSSSSVKVSFSTDQSRLVIQSLQCLQRLVTSPLVATQLTGTSGGSGKIFAALLCGHEHIVFEAARLLLRLFAPTSGRTGSAPWPSESDHQSTKEGAGSGPRGRSASDGFSGFSFHDDTAVSRTAKSICFIADARCKSLLAPLTQTTPLPSPLVTVAVVEAAVSVACRPGSRTTELATREVLMQEIGSLGRPLFSLLRHPCRRAANGASLLMQAVAEGGADAAGPMRQSALSEGAVLHHLLESLGPPNRPSTKLSRNLISLWADDFAPTLSLLHRIFPRGLLRYLDEPKQRKLPPRIMGPFEHRSVTASSGDLIQSISEEITTGDGSAGDMHLGVEQHTRSSLGSSAPPSRDARWSSALHSQQHFSEDVANPLNEAKKQQISEVSRLMAGVGKSTHNAQMNSETVMQPPVAPMISSTKEHLARESNTDTLSFVPSLEESSGKDVKEFSARSIPSTIAVPQHLLSGGRRITDGSGQLRANWGAFWDALDRDHSHAALIWNERTRLDLRSALQEEENLFLTERQRIADAGQGLPVWNSADFEVSYPSLSSNMSVGGIYVRTLVSSHDIASERSPNETSPPIKDVDHLPDPKGFFTSAHLYFLRVGSTASAFSSASSSSNVFQNAIQHSQVRPDTSTPQKARGWMSHEKTAGMVAEEQELCIQAMALAYSAHPMKIGPIDVDTMRHFVSVFDMTSRRSLRLHLLRLFESFMAPAGAADDAHLERDHSGGGRSRWPVPNGNDSSRARLHSVPEASSYGVERRKASDRKKIQDLPVKNANAFILSGGIEPLVAIVAAAHEASETSTVALQTGLITSTSHADEIKVWYYLPIAVVLEKDTVTVQESEARSSGSQRSKEELLAIFESKRHGPITKKEIRQLYARGSIDASTLFWASDMAEPTPLRSLRELRWWISTGPAPMTPFHAAATALRILYSMVSLRPAVSELSGEVVIPLPAAHRQLASPRCLPHIVQILLSGEPELVDLASKLLIKILEHNTHALSKLYRTGLFFFVFAYCGSNFAEAAKLLHLAHLKQQFHGFSDLRAYILLSDRSFIGNLLPESLLYLLETRGPRAFAEALTCDTDNPEVIWTHRMRGQRLVPQMLRHLGDFPRLLKEKWSSIYEFTPCPPVGYPELDGEFWCYRYEHRFREERIQNISWLMFSEIFDSTLYLDDLCSISYDRSMTQYHYTNIEIIGRYPLASSKEHNNDAARICS